MRKISVKEVLELTMGSIISLPKPNQNGPMSLEQAIAARRSRRDFLSKPLTLEQIGQLTWAAQGKDAKSGYRTTPSAGATYPLELFVVNENGISHYLLDKHALETITEQDVRSKLASAAWGQEFIGAAPLTLVFAAQFARTTGRYGQRGIGYVYMEAGHAAQNVHLQAESLGLGSVAVGAFDNASVSKVLLLPDYLEPVYMVVVGFYRD
jgi:SagB-type dehydrogenase family enzyme